MKFDAFVPRSWAFYILCIGLGLSSVARAADTTPPSTPVVTDAGVYTPSTASLTIQFQTSDAESPTLSCVLEVRQDSAAGPLVQTTASPCTSGAPNRVTLFLTLTQAKTYFVGARARNGVGLWSAIGFSDGIKVDASAPSAPGLPREGATFGIDVDYVGSASYSVKWDASTDVESGIAAYEYQERTGSAGSWVTLGTNNAGYLFFQTIRVDGKAHNTRSFYRVRAKNGAGTWGPWSGSDGILVDLTPPAPVLVTDDGATTSSASQLHVVWTPSSDVESGVVRYYIEVREGSTSGPLVAVVAPSPSVQPSTAVTISGLALTPGSTFYVGVEAVNGADVRGVPVYSDGIRVTPGVPSLPSVVRTSGRQLLLQRRQPDGTLAPATPYIMRAVNWSPAGPTTNTWAKDPNNVTVRRPEFGAWYLRDIPLLKAMNVNTVRLFLDPGVPGDPNVTIPGLAVLDELYRNGIMVIMTVDNGNNTVSRIQPVLNQYRNHPAILMWSLGSEWNINWFWKAGTGPGQFSTLESVAQAIESAAQMVKSFDTLHPVVSSYGNIDAKPNDIERYVTQTCPTIDVWSFNEYTGPGFSRLFDKWKFISGKPMFLGEFGIDAFNSTTQREDQSTHAQWTGQLWDEIARNLSATDPNKVALGGSVMAFNDEWWKTGNPYQQDTGGWNPIAFPDKAASEEWWGIVTIERVVRQLYHSLTTRFAPGYQPPAASRTITYKAESTSPYPYWARFLEGGALMYEGRGAILDGGRGFNIATIDLATGRLRDPIQRFDTWASHSTHTSTNADAMVAYLDSVPVGTLVLIAVADEAGLNDWSSCRILPDPWVNAVINRLEALGSRQIRQLCYSDNFSLISIKGQGAALSEVLGHGDVDAIATATVQLP